MSMSTFMTSTALTWPSISTSAIGSPPLDVGPLVADLDLDGHELDPGEVVAVVVGLADLGPLLSTQGRTANARPCRGILGEVTRYVHVSRRTCDSRELAAGSRSRATRFLQVSLQWFSSPRLTLAVGTTKHGWRRTGVWDVS
jgi:hypothetical protein